MLVTINICCEWIRNPLQITLWLRFWLLVTGSKHCQTEDLWCFLIKWQNPKKGQNCNLQKHFSLDSKEWRSKCEWFLTNAIQTQDSKTHCFKVGQPWQRAGKRFLLGLGPPPSSIFFLSFKFEKLNYFCECEKSVILISTNESIMLPSSLIKQFGSCRMRFIYFCQ